MQAPAIASLNSILPAVRPVEASVGWQRDAALRLGRDVVAQDRQRTRPEGHEDPARTRRTRSHEEPRRARQAGQGEDSIRDSQAQAGKRNKAPQSRETRRFDRFRGTSAGKPHAAGQCGGWRDLAGAHAGRRGTGVFCGKDGR